MCRLFHTHTHKKKQNYFFLQLKKVQILYCSFIFISTALSILPLSQSKRCNFTSAQVAPQTWALPGLGSQHQISVAHQAGGRTCGKATLAGSSRVKAKVCVFSRMRACLPSRQNTRPGQEMGVLVPPVRGNRAADKMTPNQAGRTSERRR